MAKRTDDQQDDLVGALLAPPAKRFTPQCQTGLMLRRLDAERPDAAAALRTVLGSPLDQYPAPEISKRLSQFGYRLGAHSIQRHRRGQCQCE